MIVFLFHIIFCICKLSCVLHLRHQLQRRRRDGKSTHRRKESTRERRAEWSGMMLPRNGDQDGVTRKPMTKLKTGSLKFQTKQVANVDNLIDWAIEFLFKKFFGETSFGEWSDGTRSTAITVGCAGPTVPSHVKHRSKTLFLKRVYALH